MIDSSATAHPVGTSFAGARPLSQLLLLFSLANFLAFILLSASSVFAWPAASSWIPVYAPDGFVQDPGGNLDTTGNGNNATDIVGDAANAAAYVYNDGIDLYFRLRLDDSPLQGGGLKAFGWGVLIDTDLDAHDYEFMLMLDGIANPDEIYLAKNTVQQAIDDPSDKPEQIEWIRLAVNGTDYIATAANTAFTGDPDYFLDFKVPYDIFLLSLGISESNLIRYFFGTSQSAQQLSADLVGSTLYDGVSDFTLPTGKRPTDGSVQFVADLAGNGDLIEFYPGTTLYLKVADDDQNTLLDSAETVTVTLTTPSGDVETVTLTETGGDTGIFTGSIVTGQSAIVAGDGVLQTVPIEFVTASYVDAADALLNIDQNRTDTVKAKPTADLGITKTASRSTPNTGETVAFTLTLTNYGPSAASGIQVRDLLQPGLTYLGASGAGTYNPATGIWAVTTLGIADSASLQIEAEVTAPPLSSIPNTATVLTAAQPDFNPTNNEASLTLAVTGADLAVAKTVAVTTPAIGGNMPAPGDLVTCTVTVTNNGSYQANGIIVRDLLPTGELTWISDTPAPGTAYDPLNGDWSIGTLENGSAVTLQIVARVDAASGSTVTSTAFILAADESDPVPANNSASAAIYVDAVELEVTKTVSDPTPDEGDTITYAVRIENLRGSTAGSLQVLDLLPNGVEFVSASPPPGTAYDQISGIWDLGLVTIAPGEFRTLAIDARVRPGTAGQVITNEALVVNCDKIDPDPESAAIAVTVRYLDLAIDKQTSNYSPEDNTPITFTVTVTNNGPIDATGVKVYDKLPVQVYNNVSGGDRNVAVTASFSDPTDTYDLATWIWEIGDLAAGASATMTISATVKVPNGGSSTFFNIARIDACDQADPISANDADSVLMGVQGTDIEVLYKSVDKPAPAAPVGTVYDTVTYTIAVRNNGPNAATNLTIREILPAGLSYVSGSAADDYTPPAGKTDQTAYTASTGIWTLGYKEGGNTIFPAGTTVILALQAQVTAAGGSVITNTALVNSLLESEINPANNSAAATVTIGGVDLEMVNLVDDASPTVGENITFTLTVNNLGPNSAAAIQVTDLLPPGLTYLSHTGDGSYDPASGLWEPGITIDPSASAVLYLTATVGSGAAGQTVTNTAAITAFSAEDPVPGNNSAAAAIVVQESDLSLIKTVGNPIPDETTSVTFTLTVGNNGPHDADGIQVLDMLPAGLTFLSAAPAVEITATANPDGTTSILWDLGSGTLAKNGIASVEITAQAALGTGGTTLTNTASIVARGNYDPNAANDAASISVTPGKIYIDLALTKTVSDSAPEEGSEITYTVTLANNNALYGASGVQVTDLLPPGIIYLGSTPEEGTTYDSATGIWQVGAVAASGVRTLIITARPAVGTGGAGPFTNTASISASDYDDPDAGNNSASVEIMPRIKPLPLLTIVKSCNKAAAQPGEFITCSVQVVNTGIAPATDVMVRDSMSPFLNLVTDPYGNGNPFQFTEGTPSSGLLPDILNFTVAPDGSWQLPMTGSMAVGGKFTLEYQATIK